MRRQRSSWARIKLSSYFKNFFFIFSSLWLIIFVNFNPFIQIIVNFVFIVSNLLGYLVSQRILFTFQCTLFCFMSPSVTTSLLYHLALILSTLFLIIFYIFFNILNYYFFRQIKQKNQYFLLLIFLWFNMLQTAWLYDITLFHFCKYLFLKKIYFFVTIKSFKSIITRKY